MRQGLLGQMVTPNSGNRLEPGVDWALDNGCFNAQWSEQRWRHTIERYAGVERCLFAVVPDVVGDAAQTDEMWERYAPFVKEHNYKAAYVTQNGCTGLPDDADAVFAGGDNTWKLGRRNAELITQANQRGLWTHMGRVNGLRRLRHAQADGYDSVDGTFLAFGPDTNLPILLGWMRRLETEPTLF